MDRPDQAELEATYRQYDEFDFDRDLDFRTGLARLFPGVNLASIPAADLAKARWFYFTKYVPADHGKEAEDPYFNICFII
ncbi:hypothetical protein IWQ60_008027 [Tieghemiomyces parasiticus]|uniref:PEX14-like helix-turn-helix domain-containing protein n=1 Tax=Tieghemiomyces parasiticus TaxID=78921 RepID=A0A9W7ZUG5_9FUNG|nr:hypothetical protein IWQ60_008027 [Tieghemiomyces parasiticus]